MTKLGLDVVRQVVRGVLAGDNLRDETELLTRRRLALSNGALLVFFHRLLAERGLSLSALMDLAAKEGGSRSISKADKWILNWILGLTGKSVQNVLRDDFGPGSPYVANYQRTVKEAAGILESEFGGLRGALRFDDGETPLDWETTVALLGSVGAQSLTLRGSDKSAYGKLFERLILGCLLTGLGFAYSREGPTAKQNRGLFWLSDRGAKREADATALLRPGVGVRFDIGFIGRGNTEISLDKVSRFERQMEIAHSKYKMHTIVVVDRIGERSRLERLAREIGGDVVQMSLRYWPRDVARIFAERFEYKHPWADASDKVLPSLLDAAVVAAPIGDFLVAKP